jgi:hypothetical protein
LARTFAERYAHYFIGFREVPGYPALPERTPDLASWPALLAGVQRERFDLTVQMHGSGTTTNPLTGLFSARQCAGYCKKGEAVRPFRE